MKSFVIPFLGQSNWIFEKVNHEFAKTSICIVQFTAGFLNFECFSFHFQQRFYLFHTENVDDFCSWWKKHVEFMVNKNFDRNKAHVKKTKQIRKNYKLLINSMVLICMNCLEFLIKFKDIKIMRIAI
jgi:hypothetical protein